MDIYFAELEKFAVLSEYGLTMSATSFTPDLMIVNQLLAKTQSMVQDKTLSGEPIVLAAQPAHIRIETLLHQRIVSVCFLHT